ncbi:hypothetical protein ITY26_004096 [Salmonella enterica]|uniref:Phage family protein n=1 Tax=Salmonella enterica subsp. enterica serovar Typhi str. CT18 TaxID=220341 RepID=A0A716E0K4_SALTI|nr:Gp49 family protein [Salmonella enterica]EAT7613199.1 hypothetical protein [Salmonella enterica subsp. enterica]EBX8162005.1 hypothetical protein [Salmonella enterica subsp. enterica serovar Heidelberg]ECS2421318.1 hypothetical protein [Salmonella enterica subsp. enterica serovar Typhimurium var. 5-]ECX0749412.1 hypothetical protein [Salmonella enterica subsp. enterica serovar Altona]EDK1855405.1 hypothetical protein [Salmonella enterica subsp. enterica serovar Newport]EEI8523602.1 hypothe
MTDMDIEKEIVTKGKTAARVTPERIESVILEEHYFTAYDGIRAANMGVNAAWAAHPSTDLLTFCVLVLENGFAVTGESACASPENFDPEIGRKIARQNAIAKIWPLEGYLLKQQLHEVK